jgi:hypothetical protein
MYIYESLKFYPFFISGHSDIIPEATTIATIQITTVQSFEMITA